MTILEALVQLRDDIKTWCINNFNNTNQNINTLKTQLQSGEIVVQVADIANIANRADEDGAGNVIVTTYETKTDAAVKLHTAKVYTDNAVAEINGIPSCNTDNNGQFLRVVRGVPTWVTVDDGDGVSY